MHDFRLKFLDPYDRPARLYPALLVFAPLAVLLVCLYSTDHIVTSSVVSILGFCGCAYMLGRVARSTGKRIQDGLFAKWGGAPTTQMLRHRNLHFDAHTKKRFHSVLAKGLGKTLPSPDEEQSDTAAADELYRAATLWLIDQTRNTKVFPLVFKENIAFGFHRNALGLRPLGVSVVGVALLWAMFHAKVVAFVAPYFAPQKALELAPPVIVTLLVSSAMLLAWVFLLNESALKRAGFSYAERLLQSCDSIKSTPRVVKKATMAARKE